MAALKFDDETIEKLFGKEAAENEDPRRLREYFFKSNIYDSMRAELPLRILVGHKGIGKSALLKICYMEDQESGVISIWLRPDDLGDIQFDDADDLNLMIRKWKSGLREKIFHSVVNSFGESDADAVMRIMKRAGSNLIQGITSYISESKPKLLGTAKEKFVDRFIRDQKVTVYIDDLDRGWQALQKDIRKISALLNALRDMSTDLPGVSFRIGLRADVYFLVRTSDESTDKIEGSVIWYTWTNHEIFLMLAKRIETFFGRDVSEKKLAALSQPQVSAYLDAIMEPRYKGRGHWENAPMYKVLLSLIRKRPRDLIKLCSGAAKIAAGQGHSIILTKDFSDSFEEYSQGRLQDTINEYRTELPVIERLLFGMKPARKERKTSLGYQYKTDQLIVKMVNIEQGGKFQFANGKTASERDLIQFLYKINFLTARKERPDGLIIRKYFDEHRYVYTQFVDFGFDWEVHPAYRWALQPESLNDIYDDLKLTEVFE